MLKHSDILTEITKYQKFFKKTNILEHIIEVLTYTMLTVNIVFTIVMNYFNARNELRNN
jgi:hypothetical protein